MTSSELRSLEKPVRPVDPGELPVPLRRRGASYNAALAAFRELAAVAREELARGRDADPAVEDELRECAVSLVAERELLLASARVAASERAGPG